MCDECYRAVAKRIDQTMWFGLSVLKKERLEVVGLAEAERSPSLGVFARLRDLSHPRGFLETLLP